MRGLQVMCSKIHYCEPTIRTALTFCHALLLAKFKSAVAKVGNIYV